MNQYRKNENYFLSYFNANIVFFLICNIILILVKKNLFDLSFEWSYLLVVPMSLILGLIVATAFHNCSHGNIKPRILNTIVGEICGAIALDGMRNFRVGHMLHHIHSHNPELDPHPPYGITFLEFIRTSKDRTIEVLIGEYYRSHGENEQSNLNIKKQLISYKIGVVLKIAFWFLLLGPVGFCLLYLPTFLSYFLGFAHLNYISHSLDVDGQEIMHNHDGGIFYSFMNLATSGGYYHKNHHKFPGLYNPKRIDRLSSSRSADQQIILN